MKFTVSVKSDGLRSVLQAVTKTALEEIEVEADDRWGAVVAAAGLWGIAEVMRMQEIFDACSVRKIERKRFREWRI